MHTPVDVGFMMFSSWTPVRPSVRTTNKCQSFPDINKVPFFHGGGGGGRDGDGDGDGDTDGDEDDSDEADEYNDGVAQLSFACFQTSNLHCVLIQMLTVV